MARLSFYAGNYIFASMIRCLRFLLLLLLPIGSLLAQSIPVLSDSARISLMSVDPGEELYTTFGHSALRVRDPWMGIDKCYNYGTFDFDQPNFYLRFVQGKLLYMLDQESYRRFEKVNLYYNRPFQEQVLQLDSTQRQKLFELLETNIRPENRNYKYDFFYDNCATRIRDILQAACGASLRFDTTQLPPATMRQLLHPSLESMPWTRFGIDLVLGAASDVPARHSDYMFLPAYLRDIVGRSTLDGRPFAPVMTHMPQYQVEKLPYEPGFLERPMLIMCLLVLLGALCRLHPKAERIFNILFFLALGLSGLLFTLLWFATDHGATKINLNILWALPVHLFFFWKKGPSKYFLFSGALAALAVLLWFFMPQEMPLPALPVAILAAVSGLWKRR